MSTNPQQPQFTQGDTVKALRVLLRDVDGNAMDLSGGTVTLLADGLDSNDRIGGASGYAGSFVTDGTNGLVDFVGIGAQSDLTSAGVFSGRRAEIYAYKVKWEPSGGGVTFTTTQTSFIVWADPS